MTAPWQSEDTIIGLVQIRGTSGDTMRDQQRIGSLLERVDLRGSRLPASSTLCIRKMQDPLPGIHWFEHRGVQVPTEWQEAAAQQLNRFASAAARPVFHPVPETAESVLFMDRAELLACLAMDWTQGRIRSNWWWAGLFRHEDANFLLTREWAAAPQYIPAAIEILTELGRAFPFLQRQEEEAAASLLRAMRSAFGIPEVDVVATFALSTGDESGIYANEHGREGRPQPRAGEAPWQPWVPEASSANLSPVKRALWGEALMLRRAPALVRTIDFQIRIARWLSAEAVQQADDGVVRSAQETGPKVEQPHSPKPRPVVGTLSSSPASETNERSKQLLDTERVVADAPYDGGRLPSIRNDGQDGEVSIENAGDSRLGFAPEPSKSSPTRDGEVVDSELGGIFFLLNVALHLGLYGDFSAPQQQGLGLDIWDFLTLVGRALIGPGREDDPVWKLLERLACRGDGQAAGDAFEAPQSWRVPADWLKCFPEDVEWKPVICGQRMQTRHPMGFLLVDEGREEIADRSILLGQWLGWIADYIRARLIRAMGSDDASECLIRVPARITLTATHVHIHYSLDRYPIEIRLAGLDRDPGWIPAAGRYVAYCFE